MWKGFFDFKQGAYREYTFDDNFECTPQINMLSWTLSNGIITATNGTAIDRWVITELTAIAWCLNSNLMSIQTVSWNYLKPSATVMNLLWR
jgi:hypothetical protein